MPHGRSPSAGAVPTFGSSGGNGAAQQPSPGVLLLLLAILLFVALVAQLVAIGPNWQEDLPQRLSDSLAALMVVLPGAL